MIAVKYGSGGTAGKAIGLRMDLLWENDDLSSNFAAQSVSVDLSGYSHYMILSIFSTSTQNINAPVVAPVESGVVLGLSCTSGSNGKVGSRTCYYDASIPGLVFAGGKYDGNNNNAYVVPKYVYGIRSGSGSSRGGGGGGGGSGVASVNGMTGVVILDAESVGAIEAPTSASSGDVLVFDGEEWTAQSGGSGAAVHTDTTANWNAQPLLITEAGHIYVYSDYTTMGGVDVPAIKIGDGLAYLIDMPFVAGNTAELTAHINDTSVHVTAGEKAFWNNKNRAYMSQGDAETLVLTTL